MRRHLKRIAAPKCMRILRKIHVWITRPSPGPHPLNRCIPLMVLVRDYLKLGTNSYECKKIIKRGEILVDGRARKSPKFPIGFMDVVSIPKMKKNYRITITKGGYIEPIEIPENESNLKICMIVNKKAIRDGKVQLNLHDGRNILLDKKEASKYQTQASILISIPDQKILNYIPFEKGTKVFLIAGTHAGETAVIEDFHNYEGPQPDRVVLKNEKGEVYETVKDYAFGIGIKKSEVTITGGNP